MEPKTAIQHRPKRTTMTKGAALPLTMGKASPHSQTAFIGGRHLCHRQAPTCREHAGPLPHAPFVLRTDPGHLARRRQHRPSTGPSTASSRSADSNPFQRLGEGHNTSTGRNVGVAVMSIQKDRLDLVADTRRAAPQPPGCPNQQALRLAGITSGKRKQPRHCRERLLYTCREAPSLGPLARSVLRNLLWKKSEFEKEDGPRTSSSLSSIKKPPREDIRVLSPPFLDCLAAHHVAPLPP